MARPRSSEIDARAEEAAFLRGSGLSQREIAARFETTQSNVSRLLKRATALGCYRLVVRHHFEKDAVSAERLQQLRSLGAPQSLLLGLQRVLPKTGVRVRGVRVVERLARVDAEHFAAELARFGRAAAAPVDELVRRARCVAVTWGSTLSCVVEGLLASPRPTALAPIRFFPVCAEPEEFAGARESSSIVAARLDSIFNEARSEQLALTRIPAFIPKRYTGAARRGIEAMIHASPSYKRIFGASSRRGAGPEPPLVAVADALLTSIGHAAHPVGFNYDELLSAGGIGAGRLRELVVGDIGGVLIRRPGLSRREQRAVDALNAMWTGLQYDDLAAIAERADRDGQPGVIVVSGGSHRDEILHAVVQKGLVNQLIVDGEAADLLLARLGPGPADAAGAAE